ncbi:MAG: outer membrane protein [Arenicella sp.]
MNIKNKTALTTAAATLITLSMSNVVQAKDGLYIGSKITNSTLSHSIERNTGSNTTPSISTTNDETDVGLGFNLGYKQHLTDNFYLAGELFYNEEDITTRNLNNLLITEVTLNNSYGFKLRTGIDITDKFSVYSALGITNLDFDLNNSYPFAPPKRSASRSESAFTFGFGGEYQVTDNLSVLAEYSQLNDVDFDPIPEVAVPGKINANELDYSSFTIGVNYAF